MKSRVILSISNSSSAIDQSIYHRAAKQLGDKFDWSMTRGELL